MDTKVDIDAIWGKGWGWLLFWGVVLIVLGLIAIGLTTLTTLLTVIFLGAILLAGGIVVIVDSFRFWGKHWGSFFIHFLIGIAYTAAGLLLMFNPVFGSMSLTWLLGWLYILLGIFRIVDSVSSRSARWSWSLFSGLLALVLGVFILISWPASSLFVIGLFVGIELVVLGWTYSLIALSRRAIFSA